MTGTRAEYGLLYWTMKTLKQQSDVSLQIIATGMHLAPEFGLTYRQIENDGFKIDWKVEMLLSSDTASSISKSMGLALIGFADAFSSLRPDIILVLGDRFEIFATVAAAMVARIPVAHCAGGEATEGLIDEPIRHSITKMSHLHFTATELYRKRVIQLGEQPTNVFNVGALGIENINRLTLLDKQTFESSIGFRFRKLNFLVTFHPVTLEYNTAETQFKNLLQALDRFPDAGVIFTKPNADTDGRIIVDMIDEYVSKNNDRAIAVASLGQMRYLSALQFVDAVIGNSSSGLVEVPSFKKPTINVGDRQRGRIKGESVIDCEPSTDSIHDAIIVSLSSDFQNRLQQIVNPYGNQNASEKITDVLKTFPLEGILKKKFFDIS